jgi:hypothetical protein
MKLAWLCYKFTYDEDYNVVIVFEEPESWEYSKVVPIVYAEIVKG